MYKFTQEAMEPCDRSSPLGFSSTIFEMDMERIMFFTSMIHPQFCEDVCYDHSRLKSGIHQFKEQFKKRLAEWRRSTKYLKVSYIKHQYLKFYSDPLNIYQKQIYLYFVWKNSVQLHQAIKDSTKEFMDIVDGLKAQMKENGGQKALQALQTQPKWSDRQIKLMVGSLFAQFSLLEPIWKQADNYVPFKTNEQIRTKFSGLCCNASNLKPQDKIQMMNLVIKELKRYVQLSYIQRQIPHSRFVGQIATRIYTLDNIDDQKWTQTIRSFFDIYLKKESNTLKSFESPKVSALEAPIIVDAYWQDKQTYNSLTSFTSGSLHKNQIKPIEVVTEVFIEDL